MAIQDGRRHGYHDNKSQKLDIALWEVRVVGF